ncbi:MAG: ROK family protein [Acidobacteriota bacterium]|nr:ROK family protein [Acidobacteriota bacterium]
MMTSTNPCVLVYDVGGSHVSAAVCQAGDYQIGPVARASHPAQQTSEAFLDVLAGLAAQVTGGTGSVLGASVAMPGPFDYAAGVSWMRHKLPYLYGFDLRQALADRLGWQPGQVRFLNDAAAYLLGEVGAGAARGATRAVGITLGTGIGSAFAVDGRIVTEGPGVPPGGEIWNLPYEGGIVEDQLSSKAIRQSYEQRTEQQQEVAAIAKAAAAEPAAAEVFAEFGRRLGRALKVLLLPFAPDVVVLGGGISRSAALFLPFAEEELAGLNLQLRVSALGDSAPLVGAGVAWFADPMVPAETRTAATR